MFTDVMNKSLDLNKRFADSLSDHELENLMSEFDNHEVMDFSDWFNNKSFTEYLCQSYKKYKLFEYFDFQERKSVSLKEDILPKNPNRVLFLFNPFAICYLN